jgi:hypothetical protein
LVVVLALVATAAVVEATGFVVSVDTPASVPFLVVATG